MNRPTLTAYRQIAESADLSKEQTWAVCRLFTDHSGTQRFSICAYGYTKERAEQAATLYKGGLAMPEAEATEKAEWYRKNHRQPVTPQIR